jgi:signal transduction histidine kinase
MRSSLPAMIRNSVARQLMLATGTVIALALLAVAATGYLIFTGTMDAGLQQSLRDDVRLRAVQQGTLFDLAQASVARLAGDWQQRVGQGSDDAVAARFEALFARSADGVWRLRPELVAPDRRPTFYLQDNPALQPGAPDPDGIRRRAVASYDLLAERGPALVPPYFSAYIDFVEKGLMVYSRGIDWGAGATPQTDNFSYPTMTGSDPRNNPTRRIFWTPVYYDSEARAWMVSVIRPLDWHGRWIGTVGHDITIDILLRQIAEARGNGTTAMILSSDGELIAHPGLEAQIHRANGQLAIAPLHDPLLNDVQTMIVTGRQDEALAHAALTPDGRHWVAWARIKGPGWWSVTVVPRSLLERQGRQAALLLFAIGLGGLLLALGLQYRVIARLIRQPLGEVAAAAEALAAGAQPAPLNLRGDNELARLAGTFDAMAGQVAARHEADRAQAAALQREVGERTAAEALAREARIAAEAANAAKTQFLANMSHELRTPLNAIIGFSEVIRDGLFGPLDERYRRYGGDIHLAGEHLLELIADILDLTLVEVGKLELDDRDCEAAQVVREALRLVRGTADQAGLTLAFEDGAPGLRLRADPLRLRQLLVNLLANAIKFTPAGGRIVASTARLADGDFRGGLRLAVRDTGIGIAPQDAERIFEPFVQVEGAQARARGGIGLGLALVRTLAELHGGRVSLDSVPGRGTTVSVDLPASRVMDGTA